MIVRHYLSTYFLLCISATNASASLIHFTNKAEWQSAVNTHNTITFTEIPPATQVTSQYAHLGVQFLSLAFTIHTSAAVNDLFGLHGPNGVRFALDMPHFAVAIDHPDVAQFELLYEGQVVATSDLFSHISGTGNFSGLISSIPFDEVYIFKPFPFVNSVLIDDLHWGMVPTPGALPLLALALLSPRRRRRST